VRRLLRGVKLHSPPRTEAIRGQPRERPESRETGAQAGFPEAVGHRERALTGGNPGKSGGPGNRRSGRVRGPGGATEDGHLLRGNPGNVRRAGQPELRTGARQRWRAKRDMFAEQSAGLGRRAERGPSISYMEGPRPIVL